MRAKDLIWGCGHNTYHCLTIKPVLKNDRVCVSFETNLKSFM